MTDISEAHRTIALPRDAASGVAGQRVLPGSPPAIVPASGVELLGRQVHSGHRVPPSLVRRSDGQMVQVTPLLYAVLESADGHRDAAQVAAQVSERTGRTVTAADIDFLVESKLQPLGLLAGAEDRPLPRSNPLLALRPRKIITDRHITRRISAPFARAFSPVVVPAVVASFIAVLTWLFFFKGLAAPLRETFHRPGLFLVVFALLMLSAGFHELGHAAGLIYGGGVPSSMGVGLYLVWPAFYTDVTDSYRLDRRARLRVDLGGIYFNALFGVIAFGLWALTGWEALLVVIPLQLFNIVRQLLPLVRLDGYHILADLTGVPDLFAHIKPILAGLLPTRWGRAESKVLKPWVRVVVTLWTFAVVPVLAFMLLTAVLMFPRLAATAWESATIQWSDLTALWGQGEYAGAAVRVLAIAALLLPVAAIAYLASRVIRRVTTRTWRATAKRPVLRSVAVMTAAALLTALTLAWWPDGQYQPIGRNASGLPVDVRFRQMLGDENGTGNAAGTRMPLTTTDAVSSNSDPVATSEEGLAPTPTAEGSQDDGAEPYGDHRFAVPDAPGAGDNQAVAINYQDGAALVDVAFSLLVLAEGTVDNNNEAWALASCNACTTIAAALQILLVVNSPETVIPENIAVAVNADCATCATYALAIQLVATITGPPSQEALAALLAVQTDLEALEAAAGDMTAEELTTELFEIRDEVVAILEADGILTAASTTISSEDPVPAPTTSPSGEPSPTPSSTPDGPEPSATPTSEPSPTPSTSPEEPQPSPSTS